MPTLHIRHLTTYRYRRPVGFGEHRLMLRPRDTHDQRVLSARLLIEPGPVQLRRVQDVFGNLVELVAFAGAAPELRFESQVVLEHTPAPLAVDSGEAIAPAGPSFPFAYGAEDMPDLLRLIERAHADPAGRVEAWARRFLRWNGPTPVLTLLAEMTRAIPAEFTYRKRLEPGVQTPQETLALRSGACRDFAVLMIDAARSLGLAARFVSGYVHSTIHDARLGGGHTHAWVQVFLPSCGWVDFDPTNGAVGAAGLVSVAIVRDPRQAAPLRGVWDGEPADYLGMEVEVEVRAEPELARQVAA